MAEENYALIKNGNVVNVAIFDNPSEQLLQQFKELHNVDSIIIATDKTAVNGTYDGVKFWLPQPYPSWVKNEELNEWQCPIPYPQDGKPYTWDEESLSWKEYVTISE